MSIPSSSTSTDNIAISMNTSNDESKQPSTSNSNGVYEKRGEKRHVEESSSSSSSSTTSTSSSSSSSSTTTTSTDNTNGVPPDDGKNEVKQPENKKAKKKKNQDAANAANGNGNGSKKGSVGELAKNKVRGLSKSQKANKLQLGIPEHPPGLEIFTLVRPVDIPAALEFYKSIGSPKFVVAPMVNQSELPFRMLTRRYGATLCYTPMMHASLFAKSPKYRLEQFQTCEGDRPLFAQFCANDPGLLLEAARHLEGKVDAIDINFGCPQGIARRGNYGSFLLNRPNILRALITVLHNYLNIPVTVKTRVLPKEEDTIKLVKMFEACGARVITIHGRTKEQLKDKTGANDFDIIKKLKNELKVPVFSNGGIELYSDVLRTLEYTGADGVMTSEGILANPAIFAGTEIPSGVRMSREYLALAREYPTESSAVRAHLIKFLFRELAVHTDLRQQLAEHKDPLNCGDLLNEIEKRDATLTADERTAREAKIPTWYRRFNPLPGQLRTRDFDKEGKLKEDKPSSSLTGSDVNATTSSVAGALPSTAATVHSVRQQKKAIKKQKKKEQAQQRIIRLAAREGMTAKEFEASERHKKHVRKEQQRAAEQRKVAALLAKAAGTDVNVAIAAAAASANGISSSLLSSTTTTISIPNGTVSTPIPLTPLITPIPPSSTTSLSSTTA